MSYYGFTLAEVLITLGIIGVVAAMTIPNLVNNSQKAQYATAAKKAYAQSNQVLQQMAVDNGTIGDISSYFSGSHAQAGSAFASYYKVVKTCGITAGEECFAKFDNNYDGSANLISSWTGLVQGGYKFITADGASFSIASYGNNCTENRGFSEAPDSPTYNSCCGFLLFDVNGVKRPNNYGRDVFLFYITDKKTPLLYPVGGFYNSTGDVGTITNGGNYYWNANGIANRCSNANKFGEFCAGRLMEKGWEMDY